MITPKQLNRFLLFKLPSAWLCGVRVLTIDEGSCKVTVTHKWMNQNPFNSMFWAVQGMAAELSTGAMVISNIRESGHSISMLVLHNKASFTKKARGKITFSCHDGHLIQQAITQTIDTGEAQTFWMTSEGIDREGDVVSTFEFEWTVKLKPKK